MSPTGGSPEEVGGQHPLSVVVLYAGAASYISACLDRLRDSASVQVWYARPAVLPDHAARPGARSLASGPAHVTAGTDVVLVSGWFNKRYLWEAWRARLRGATVVVVFDTQAGCGVLWRGQAWLLGQVLRRIYHGAFVAGERQRRVAEALGFSPEAIEIGFLSSADVAEDERSRHDSRFVWVGRLVPDKGLEVFLDAYARYRDRSEQPWPVRIAGDGVLRHLLEAAPIEGVEWLGAVPPDEVADLMRSSGCLVSSSRVEPWGMVIGEAASMGLPVIATDRAGAVDHLVINGISGRVVAAEDPEALAVAMLDVGGRTREERIAMGSVSRSLAAEFTPERWVRRLEELRVRLER